MCNTCFYRSADKPRVIPFLRLTQYYAPGLAKVGVGSGIWDAQVSPQGQWLYYNKSPPTSHFTLLVLHYTVVILKYSTNPPMWKVSGQMLTRPDVPTLMNWSWLMHSGFRLCLTHWLWDSCIQAPGSVSHIGCETHAFRLQALSHALVVRLMHSGFRLCLTHWLWDSCIQASGSVSYIGCETHAFRLQALSHALVVRLMHSGFRLCLIHWLWDSCIQASGSVSRIGRETHAFRLQAVSRIGRETHAFRLQALSHAYPNKYHAKTLKQSHSLTKNGHYK